MLGRHFPVTSHWIRLLCLISLLLAHGPQHHAFAHGHGDSSNERAECHVNVPHIESATAHALDPETDCLACQWQSGKMLAAAPSRFEVAPVRYSVLIPYETADSRLERSATYVRGPPLLSA
jgi:hypothetical protein